MNNMFEYKEENSNSKIHRPGIDNCEPKIEKIKEDFKSKCLTEPLNDKYKFGYFITQSFNKPIKIKDTSLYCDTSFFYEINTKVNTKVKTNVNNTNLKESYYYDNIYNKYNQILNIYMFQLAIGYKSLEISKIVNSDLHIGNILSDTNIIIDDIEDDSRYKSLITKNNFFNFLIEDKKYNINLPFLIKIYDFDRSYLYGNKKDENENEIKKYYTEIKNDDIDIKNEYSSVFKYYSLSNLRGFLFTTQYNIMNLKGWIESNRAYKAENKFASKLLNEYTSIILKEPKENFTNINIYTNTKDGKIITNKIDYLEDNYENYNNLSHLSKYYLFFLENVYPLIVSSEVNNIDEFLRNETINDKTFDTDIFYSITEIIDNIYNKINENFKKFGSENTNDTNVKKFYLSESFMDDGIFNNATYQSFIENSKKISQPPPPPMKQPPPPPMKQPPHPPMKQPPPPPNRLTMKQPPPPPNF